MVDSALRGRHRRTLAARARELRGSGSSRARRLAAAALALLVNQSIAHIWNRSRPFATHADATVFGARSHDPSFPSDHASAAFAIALTVLLFDRVAGEIFILAAASIAVGRVVTGVHYPSDVVAGVLVGAGAALVVVRLGGPLIDKGLCTWPSG